MHPDEACWALVPETKVKLVPPKCTGLSMLRDAVEGRDSIAAAPL